ncbi:hypothetical protein H5P36_17975 [Bacillus sp. APMAM]|nr:hypothetical protein [Bacillus sp. APMAM]
MAFTNINGAISIYPPLDTEVTVASLTTNVISGENIKIDYSLSVEEVNTANSQITFEVRLYRDTTFLHTRIFQRHIDTASTQRFPLADTYVDTAITTGTVTYTVRVIYTTANNVTESTAFNRDLNLIKFP